MSFRQLRECPQCKVYLPHDEFRTLRGSRKRRARVCELCELLNKEKIIRTRRKRRRAEEEARRELWSRKDVGA
jgi:hypothetical protein